ncbi:aldose 1-epimerase [Ligilactobacillus salitolerans]|uniref:Aldose 1-epimerase n=1 Tax=Ligilactobacillus salitolerans TaxID=1808352 RepID=A0A401ITK9_9LACO|nr:aldose 1-epimerase family protein [Ligilactobacillus salitolerans]GBG94880.1 aldose 1-epimerase [Ligilactobacillus salitolerans]
MAVIIENEQIRAVINEHGAELSSLIAKKTGIDYIWSGDSKYWGRHSPVLFPIEGKLKDDHYFFAGKEYHMTQHGFARDQDFTVIEQDSSHAIFELTQNAATLEKYPFDFRLRLTYTIVNSELTLGYSVYDPADQDLYFAIGAHPAFKAPLMPNEEYSDYELEFSPAKTRHKIPLADSLTDPKKQYPVDENHLSVSRELFKDDALIYNLNREETIITLADKAKTHGISLNTKDAKFVGIWSSYPANGQFVCIEPWWGLADPQDSDGELTHKYAINKLAPKTEFQAGFSVSVF